MEILLITITAEEALAYTEALSINGVEKPTALIWQDKNRIAALGISQKAETELNLPNITADDVRIVRRQSGGGAVILGDGTLCFEVIAPIRNSLTDLGIRESFIEYTQPLIDVLRYYNLPARVNGISDITLKHCGNDKKIAGCAQLRKKAALVVHASILVNLDKSLLEKYLRFPSDVPAYREKRTHTDFCLNLSELIPDYTVHRLSNDLTAEFSRRGWDIITTKPILSDLGRRLLDEKYRQTSWNINRQRPKIF